MWFDRVIEYELKQLSATFPVIVLTGPRQVGKTSAMERAFPDCPYVSLDSGANAEAARTNPREFLDRLGAPAIIDEVQYAPDILREIKVRVDIHSNAKGLYFLTGSQSFPLMASVSESLAGRAAVIPLLGFSGDEWENGPRGAALWEDFFFAGSFPGLWTDPDHPPSRERWYQGYVATYLERDVRNILAVSNLRDFERFLRAAAARTAQMLNISELARDVGVSPNTARQWLNVLVASNQIYLLEPYHRSLGKRIAKSPKLYFTDSGLATYLTGFSSYESLATSPSVGAFWENYVVGQWIRFRDWRSPSTGLWYWRDQSGYEVDLVIEKNGLLYPVECKKKELPDSGDCRGLRRFAEFYGTSAIGQSFVACTTRETYTIDSSIRVVDGRTVWELRPEGAIA